VNQEINTESFIANVRKGAGGENTTLEITIDYKVAQYLGLRAGDKVKVLVKKINTQEAGVEVE